MLLSFAASAHSVSHINDGINGHCTLCFHQHQLSNAVKSSSLSLPFIPQGYERQQFELQPYFSFTTTAYSSRAPPSFLL
ncbi:ABC-type zinc uptake system zinc chaperone [Parashewanella spongiae]|nr:ABC-type zinc uptake system zinc chaperone [Parashewanella spongiae]MCL1079438.1 ABC-type zinc uptake system zinc chaperone [Parashewanella spongiae]